VFGFSSIDYHFCLFFVFGNSWLFFCDGFGDLIFDIGDLIFDIYV